MAKNPNMETFTNGCTVYKPTIAGYEPHTTVYDQCKIDLDQTAIETVLKDDDFERAQSIYNTGGNSRSYAVLKLVRPVPNHDITKEQAPQITGFSEECGEIHAVLHMDFYTGDDTMLIEYVEENECQCRVGGLPNESTTTNGCLEEKGTIHINNVGYQYHYNMDDDNKNAMSISNLTGESGVMYDGLMNSRYYTDFFGDSNFSDTLMQAAFDKEPANFDKGNECVDNLDFSKHSIEQRKQVIKKVSAYMKLPMAALTEMDRAVSICEEDSMDYNMKSVYKFDASVCYLTGSMQGKDGDGNGKLMFELMKKRCKDFMTCGVNGSSLSGMAKVNYDLIDLLDLGQHQLRRRNCPGARMSVNRIAIKMLIPLIQATIKSAHDIQIIMSNSIKISKEKAKLELFALAALPRIYAVDPNAAQIIREYTMFGAANVDALAIKKAFEMAYPRLGISCVDVGGLFNSDKDEYYESMGPCNDNFVVDEPPPDQEEPVDEEDAQASGDEDFNDPATGGGDGTTPPPPPPEEDDPPVSEEPDDPRENSVDEDSPPGPAPGDEGDEGDNGDGGDGNEDGEGAGWTVDRSRMLANGDVVKYLINEDIDLEEAHHIIDSMKNLGAKQDTSFFFENDLISKKSCDALIKDVELSHEEDLASEEAELPVGTADIMDQEHRTWRSESKGADFYSKKLYANDLVELIGREETLKIIDFFESLGDLTIDTMYVSLHTSHSSDDEHQVYWHVDDYATMEITLNSDFEGGHILHLNGDGVHKTESSVGSAVAHKDDIVHGITPKAGTRYMLLLKHHFNTPEKDGVVRLSRELVEEVTREHGSLRKRSIAI